MGRSSSLWKLGTFGLGLLFLIPQGVAMGAEILAPFRIAAYRITVADQPAGWMRWALHRIEHEGRPAYRVESEQYLSVRRSGTPVWLRRRRTAIFSAEPPFTPLLLRVQTQEGSGWRVAECRFVAGRGEIRSQVGQRERVSEVPVPSGTLLEDAIPLFLTAASWEPGQTRAVVVFNSEILRPIAGTLRFLGVEQLARPEGEPVPVRHFRQELDWMGGLRSEEWYHPDGTLERLEIGLGGLRLRRDRTEHLLQDPDQPAPELDLLGATHVPTVGRPEDRSQVRLRIGFRAGEATDSLWLLSTARQRVELREGGILEVFLQQDAPPSSPLPYPLPNLAPELNAYLRASPFVEADDPAIRAAAVAAVGEAETAWEAAANIARWVYRYVEHKGLDQGFASARETLDSRSGDCSEHTVLAVALSRAVGLPARILAGLVWEGAGMSYHFWHEVWVGSWVALDATLGQVPADATHLQLSPAQPESETALEFGVGILHTLNRITVEFLPNVD